MGDALDNAGEWQPVDTGLRDTVLHRLGVPPAPRDPPLDWVAAFYRGWCGHVPFDNVWRLLHLAAGEQEPLPGLPPERFLHDWLMHGVGNMCVPAAEAMIALLRSAGVDARRVVATIEDADSGQVPDHLTTLVVVGGESYVLDTLNMSDQPVALHTGRYDHSEVHRSSVDQHLGRWRISYLTAVQRHQESCLLLDLDAPPEVSAPLYRTTQASSTFRSFNRKLYSRRNTRSGILTVSGRRAAHTGLDGRVEIEEPGDLPAFLVTRAGYSTQVVNRLVEDCPAALGLERVPG